MHRRSFLASSALALSATAGCLGDDGESGSPDSNADGYAPESVDSPESMDVDPDSFERLEVEGEQVPLAPIEATYNWYARREARFADARGEGQYEDARIEGAALSTAPDGLEDDPVEEWPNDDRIVCYCGCPHHLSSLRASALISAGYEDVYVIDEGFHEWDELGHPVVGADVGSRASYAVRGRTDAAYAGEPVYAIHEPSDQREANFVGDDGGYELTLQFNDVSDDSEIRVDAPDYTVAAPLSQLTAEVVTRP